MYTFQESRTVSGKSPHQVFDFVTDPSRGAEWNAAASEVRAEGEPGPGRRLIAKAGLLGIGFEVEQVVDVWEPGARYAWSGTKPFHSAFEFRFTEVEGGTRVDAKVEFDPGKFFKLGTGKVAARTYEKMFTNDLNTLVKLVEAT